uniref:Transmembrane protein n=1 Tax=Marseillevirus LCMAC101 TaxID=2506602 RepID=A0A481YSZ6_9VIRU|nr:MAG: hypothetical protein LCMAC101_07940 [Marseillevirus LCMAC101]
MPKNIGVIVVLVIAMVIGFISMVTSAMAASDVRKYQDEKNQSNDDTLNEAHKTATVSAVLQGVVLGLILVSLLIYLLYKKGGDIQTGLQDAHAGVTAKIGDAQTWYGQQNIAT